MKWKDRKQFRELEKKIKKGIATEQELDEQIVLLYEEVHKLRNFNIWFKLISYIFCSVLFAICTIFSKDIPPRICFAFGTMIWSANAGANIVNFNMFYKRSK